MPTLDWENKSDALRAAKNIPYRLLEFDSALSSGLDENLIIQGDNLDALNSLLPFYRGRVKCIYIDPPYNTHSAFEHYDDNFEHAEWLSMMYPRLELLRDFLSDDGAIFISIDDEEAHYLKVICDEIFGRKNFVAMFAWKRKKEIANDSRNVSTQGEYILCYSKTAQTELKSEPLAEDYIRKSYKKPTEEFPLDFWRPVPITVSKGLSGGGYEYKIKTPSGVEHERLWAYPQHRYEELVANHKIYFGKDGKAIPQRVMYLSESKGKPVSNYWDDVSTNKEGKKEILSIFDKNIFDTPKPTRLIEKILRLATEKNSLVLDAFAGSGTTAHAVINLNATDGGARKFILIEEKEYCKTITAERVRRVGGSFKYFRVGAKLFEETGALNPAVTARELAAFIWFKFTGRAYPSEENLPLIGIHEGAAYYLASEPLTKKFLATLPAYDGQKIIFGATSRLSADFLSANKIIFKQLPSEIKA